MTATHLRDPSAPVSDPRSPAAREQTATLLKEFHRTRDPALRSRLIEAHLPLVRALARRFAGRAEMDDLVQVGTIGLIVAIDRFDISRRTTLATYAIPTILGELRHYLRRHERRPADGSAARVHALPPDYDRRDPWGERALSQGELRMLLESSIRCLEPRQRLVLFLRYFRDLPQARIGAEVGLSQVHVGRILDASIVRLRDELLLE